MKDEKRFYPMRPRPTHVKTEETMLWAANPSQVLNFGYFLLSTLIFLVIILVLPEYWYLGFVAVAFAFWKYLVLRNNLYKITSERFIHAQGVFSRHTEHLELYRIKDYSLSVPLHLRLFGLSNVFLLTSDPATPKVVIKGIKDGDKILSTLRNRVEHLRYVKGVREID